MIFKCLWPICKNGCWHFLVPRWCNCVTVPLKQLHCCTKVPWSYHLTTWWLENTCQIIWSYVIVGSVLTLCDFSLWGFVYSKVYRNNYQTILESLAEGRDPNSEWQHLDRRFKSRLRKIQRLQIFFILKSEILKYYWWLKSYL